MKIPRHTRGGYAMIVTAIMFMAVSLVIALGLTTPIIRQIAETTDIWNAKQSYYVSQSGVEDVLYRLESASFSQYIGSAEGITLNGAGATTTFSGSLSSQNGLTLSTLSNESGYDKTVKATVKQGAGVAFTYGVQVGTGGITLASGQVNGNVFSNGNISATNETAKITGSAIVANGAGMTEDQSNDSPSSPPDSITFGNAASTQDAAQSFQVSTTSSVTQVSVNLKKTGNPANLTLKIVKDKSGSPSTSGSDVIASGALSSSLVTTSYGWIDVALSPNPALVPGTSYWIVLDGTNNASNYYVIGANLDTSYASGTAKTGTLGGSWSNAGYDAYFRVYLGGFFGQITGISQYNPIYVGTTASDTAWAHGASYVQAAGTLRCQDQLLNNKACDQSYPDPSQANWPVSNGNISDWEAAAAAGGVISGNDTISGGTTVTLGPKKINGNLDVTGGSTLVVSGTLYVTGTVTIDGGSTVKLSSAYGTNDGVIVADGIVSISGGGDATGDGQSGSYIMILTTSNCAGGSTCSGNYAVSISGGSGAVILNAQNGWIHVTGGSNLNEATANGMLIDGGSAVTYQSGLANMNFSSGPSGGYNITSWNEAGN
ncbi:MAG: hypothetical protein KGH93_01140 [Patescibacteria group bacterium]|nr:hypothetical protein [Patescibacteria group bacterium]MDE1945786.1 hypothetical protein [Patescibacteria group bacterium]